MLEFAAAPAAPIVATAAAQPADVTPPSDAVARTADLAILPFANNTGVAEAQDLLGPALERALAAHGLELHTSAELRPLLRRHRIRSRGWISKEGAQLIAEASQARHLLIGSWDILRLEGNPEIGVSLRVMDLGTLQIVGAVSHGATGEDYTGWLDLGRVTDPQILAERVLEEAVDRLWPLPPPPRAGRGCRQLALVPLDNISEAGRAGEILTNILLSRLLAGGYLVLEPGFVRELGLAREVVAMGAVDAASARAIGEEFGVCWIVTGIVEATEVARGDPATAVPSLAVWLRVTSPESGNLLLLRDYRGTGGDDDGFFQIGRRRALIPLADNMLRSFPKALDRLNEEDRDRDR